MSVAIVTGASSGLGRQFVQTIIGAVPAVDRIWIIARRRDRLVQLAAEHPERTFEVLPLDLTKADDMQELGSRLEREHPHVQLLVNNAGLLHSGPFAEASPAEQQAEIDVNAAAPVALSKVVAPYLVRGSAIVNVCSVTAFSPIPNMAVYAASKAFLYSFSLALRAELRDAGINVLALCPGNMKTEMNSDPGAVGVETGLISRLPFLDLPTVTRTTLRLALAGRAVYTPNPVYKAYRVLAKVVPHQALARFTRI